MVFFRRKLDISARSNHSTPQASPPLHHAYAIAFATQKGSCPIPQSVLDQVRNNAKNTNPGSQ